MAKSTHERQLARARDRRKQDTLARRRSRSRVLVAVVVGLLVLSLVGVAVVGAFDGDDDGDGDDPVVTAPDDEAPDATEDDEPGAADPDDPPAETDADDPDAAVADDGADGGPDTAAASEVACPEVPDDVPEVDSAIYEAAPEMTIDPDERHVATIATTCGDIVVELDATSAPLAVNNLVFLAEEGYYEGVGFHRVIEGFVAQAGDPAGTGCGRQDCSAAGEDEATYPGYTFADELEGAEALVAEEGGYPQGTLAMANAGPDTNGSQWFIVEPAGGADLPPSYTAFGQVIEGQDVVASIVRSPTEGETPVDPVLITSVTVEIG